VERQERQRRLDEGELPDFLPVRPLTSPTSPIQFKSNQINSTHSTQPTHSSSHSAPQFIGISHCVCCVVCAPLCMCGPLSMGWDGRWRRCCAVNWLGARREVEWSLHSFGSVGPSGGVDLPCQSSNAPPRTQLRRLCGDGGLRGLHFPYLVQCHRRANQCQGCGPSNPQCRGDRRAGATTAIEQTDGHSDGETERMAPSRKTHSGGRVSRLLHPSPFITAKQSRGRRIDPLRSPTPSPLPSSLPHSPLCCFFSLLLCSLVLSGRPCPLLWWILVFFSSTTHGRSTALHSF